MHCNLRPLDAAPVVLGCFWHSFRSKLRQGVARGALGARAPQTWLDLIYPTSTWTYWATLLRHSCLLRAATSASSQVSPIPRRSFLTIPLQFVLGRPGPLLKPGTSQYSAWCVMRRWSIRIVWPSQRSLLPLRVFRMLCWWNKWHKSTSKTCSQSNSKFNTINAKSIE